MRGLGCSSAAARCPGSAAGRPRADAAAGIGLRSGEHAGLRPARLRPAARRGRDRGGAGRRLSSCTRPARRSAPPRILPRNVAALRIAGATATLTLVPGATWRVLRLRDRLVIDMSSIRQPGARRPAPRTPCRSRRRARSSPARRPAARPRPGRRRTAAAEPRPTGAASAAARRRCSATPRPPPAATVSAHAAPAGTRAARRRQRNRAAAPSAAGRARCARGHDCAIGRCRAPVRADRRRRSVPPRPARRRGVRRAPAARSRGGAERPRLRRRHGPAAAGGDRPAAAAAAGDGASPRPHRRRLGAARAARRAGGRCRADPAGAVRPAKFGCRPRMPARWSRCRTR